MSGRPESDKKVFRDHPKRVVTAVSLLLTGAICTAYFSPRPHTDATPAPTTTNSANAAPDSLRVSGGNAELDVFVAGRTNSVATTMRGLGAPVTIYPKTSSAATGKGIGEIPESLTPISVVCVGEDFVQIEKEVPPYPQGNVFMGSAAVTSLATAYNFESCSPDRPPQG